MNLQQLAGSGIYFDTKKESLLEDFLRLSKVSQLGKGANGLTMLAELDDKAASPYRSMDLTRYGSPVNKLLLKFCYLENHTTLIPKLNPTDQQTFDMEVNAQTEVFLKTNQYLEPLCPAIVFAGTFTRDQSPLLQICVERLQEQNPFLGAIQKMVQETNAKFGIIAMELADGYVSLWHYEQKHPASSRARSFVLAALLRMAKETGYNHGDFHRSNFMVRDSSNPDYFRALVIDFGMVQKMTRDQQRGFDQLFLEKKYDEALLYLCKAFFRRDGISFEHEVYNLVCKAVSDFGYRTTREQFNSSISTALAYMREQETINIKRMEERHQKYPQFYPLLPLQASARSLMFSGVSTRERSDRGLPLATVLGMSEATIQSNLEQAAKVAATDSLLFSKAVVQAYGYAKEKSNLRKVYFSSLLYCCMVCQGMLQPSGELPLAVEGMAEEIADTMDNIGKCRWNVVTPSFLDNLTTNGFAALRALPMSEVALLLANNSTYTDPVAAAEKLNRAGKEKSSSNAKKGVLGYMRQGMRQLFNKQPNSDYVFPFADQADVGGQAKRGGRRRATKKGEGVGVPRRRKTTRRINSRRRYRI